MKIGEYHYTESGLDSIYLLDGFRIVDSDRGRSVIIQDIEGLHLAIGQWLTREKKKLSGKEFRFLRTELLMSQRALADLLHVDEQTIARWEKGKTPIPAASDATLRLLYLEHVGGSEKISKLLRSIADIEDSMVRKIMMEREAHNAWELSDAA